MAAEVLAERGLRVDVHEAMPSPGRKLLMAGRGGLNLTHGEDFERFVQRYGARRTAIEPWLRRFGPQALRAWADGLGADTFAGSSGRVFPRAMKASPLLRAWLARLQRLGVRLHLRERCLGFDAAGGLRLHTAQGERVVRPDATVLALGGGSWARLGSDGAWTAWLDTEIAPLLPANCGFHIAWSRHFADRHAGTPLKSVRLSFSDGDAHFEREGECVITRHGIEGGLIYAVSSMLRDVLLREGQACFTLDLAPGREAARLLAEIAHPRGARSMSSHLASRAGIAGVKADLLREALPREQWNDAVALARMAKALPLTVSAMRPLDEAISSAGGVRLESLDASLMIKTRPGVFCAGEMLDWDAPTGGYLLTACLASGRMAAEGVLAWLDMPAS